MSGSRIAKLASLTRNESSPFFGRYRLRGDQVSPNYRPSYDVYLRLKPETLEEALGLHGMLEYPIAGLLQVYDPQAIRNPMNSIEFPFDETTHLLGFCMMADLIYIGEETIYAGIALFAPYVEDGHFFVYSTGDGDDRWIHEYRITDGELEFARHVAAGEIYTGRLDFYLTRDDPSPQWAKFVDDQLSAMSRRVYPHIALRWWAMQESALRPAFAPAHDEDAAAAARMLRGALGSAPAELDLLGTNSAWDSKTTRWIVVEKQTVGWVRVLRADEHDELERLVIAPTFHRQGLGEAVLRIVQGEAISNNRPLRLSVPHATASVLCERLGFAQVEQNDARVVVVHPPSARGR